MSGALDQQDKRMAVILPDDAIKAWLDAPVDRSMEFMRQFPAERLMATPEPVQANGKTVRRLRRRST